MRADRFITAVCASFLAMPAIAQETFLDDIVVTAGEEKVAIDTPQSVSVVTAEDLADPSVQTVGDAIGDLPGVTLIGSGSSLGQSFNIRGIGSITSGDESRFIMNIDGASKYFEQYRMGSLFADPAMFKAVEVLRGPASSTLYGAGALAGVINMETIDPSDLIEDGETSGGNFSLGFSGDKGTGSRYSASLGYAWQVNPNTAFLAALSYKLRDNYVDGNQVVVEGSESETYTALVKGVFDFGAGDAHSIEASWLQLYSDRQNVSFAQTGYVGGAFGTVDRVVTDNTANLTYRYSPEENRLVDLRVTLSYTESRMDHTNVSLFFYPPEWTTSYDKYALTVENVADISSGLWESYLTAGLTASTKDRISISTPTVGSQPEGVTDTFGAYVQGEFTFDDRLTLVPGLRVDAVKQTAGASTTTAGATNDYLLISPKLAAHYQINDTFAIFGSVAHTENSPVVDMLYDAGSGNLGLTKEQSDNIELGFTIQGYDLLQDSDVAKLKVTGYTNHVTDMVDRDGLTQFGNLTDVVFSGIELEAAYDSELYFATLTYSQVRRDLLDGVSRNSNPADELLVKLGTRLPSYDLSLAWQTRAVADQPDGPTAGYVLHDLIAIYEPDNGLLDGWEIRGEINNVFDVEYITHLNAIAQSGNSRGLSASLSIGRSF